MNVELHVSKHCKGSQGQYVISSAELEAAMKWPKGVLRPRMEIVEPCGRNVPVRYSGRLPGINPEATAEWYFASACKTVQLKVVTDRS